MVAEKYAHALGELKAGYKCYGVLVKGLCISWRVCMFVLRDLCIS